MMCAAFIVLALLVGFAVGYKAASYGLQRDCRAMLAESQWLRDEAQRLLDDARKLREIARKLSEVQT